MKPNARRTPSSPGPSRKRTAPEWSELVRAWKASGLTAAEFAASRDIKSGTLVWWQWCLRATATTSKQTSTRKRKDTSARLLPVRVVAEPAATPTSLAPAARLDGWELSSATGHVLRVHGALDADSLSSILAAMNALPRSGRR